MIAKTAGPHPRDAMNHLARDLAANRRKTFSAADGSAHPLH
jgi:hypothetical protein